MNAQPPTLSRRANRLNRRIRLRFGGVVASELLKLWSLASTRWLAGIAVALTAAVAALNAWSVTFMASIDLNTGEILATPRPVEAAQIWTTLGSSASMTALVVAIFGVMAITSEYTTSAIQSSLVADPRRVGFYAAKSIAVAAFAFAIGAVAVLLGWGVTALMIAGHDVTALSGDQWRVMPVVLVGFPFAMALTALLALGLGGLTRSTVGGVSAVVVLMMILSSVVSIVSIAASQLDWLGSVAYCMPDAAMNAFMTAGVQSSSDAAVAAVTGANETWRPEWWQSGLIFLAWAAVAWGGGLAVTARADVR